MQDSIEVDVKDPVAEAQDSAEEKQAEREPETAAETLEKLRPSKEPVVRRVGAGDEAREYVQKPLSFFGKMDFYALVGKTLDEAMKGPDGMSIDALLDGVVTSSGSELSATDLMAADSMLSTIGKLARYAPQLLMDCYVIWLDVPLEERSWFKQAVARPVDEGGLSDEDGIDILNVFIAQNASAIEAFFSKHLPLVSKAFRESRGGE